MPRHNGHKAHHRRRRQNHRPTCSCHTCRNRRQRQAAGFTPAYKMHEQATNGGLKIPLPGE